MAEKITLLPKQDLFLYPDTPLQAGQEFVSLRFAQEAIPALEVGRYRILRIEEQEVVTVYPSLFSILQAEQDQIQVQVSDFPGEKTFYRFSIKDRDVLHHRLQLKGEKAESLLLEQKAFQPILMRLLEDLAKPHSRKR